MTSFSEYKENAKPAGLKASDMANSKEAFCVTGTPEFVEGQYKDQKTYQHKVSLIHLVDGKRNSETVFMPGSAFFKNFFAGLDENPQFRHNLYLYKDGQAYDIGQKDGTCPCKHGTNGSAPKQSNASVSRETQPTDAEDIDFFTPDGEEIKLSNKPGSMTAKQSRDYLTLCIALRQEPVSDDIMEEWSEQEADKAILRLRAVQVTGNGKVKK